MDNKQILEQFWAIMQTNDFYAVGQLLHDDFILKWPQPGEHIRGRGKFAALNTAYPAEGAWSFTINRIFSEGDKVVTDVTVTDGKRVDRPITFSTIRDGKIWRRVKFWPEPFGAPTWQANWVEKI